MSYVDSVVDWENKTILKKKKKDAIICHCSLKKMCMRTHTQQLTDTQSHTQTTVTNNYVIVMLGEHFIVLATTVNVNVGILDAFFFHDYADAIVESAIVAVSVVFCVVFPSPSLFLSTLSSVVWCKIATRRV